MAGHSCVMHYLQIWCYAVTLAVCVSQVATASSSDSQEIIFGLIVGDGGKSGAREWVENAIIEVNGRSDLLSDYRLKSIPLSVDSEVILHGPAP